MYGKKARSQWERAFYSFAVFSYFTPIQPEMTMRWTSLVPS